MAASLLSMCISSFTAVFLVLTFLAVAMRLIMVIFPEKKIEGGTDDALVYAAISATYARLFPGTKVSKIEEIKKIN